MAKILIAEDVHDIRKVLGMLLAPYGHEIVEAENGQKAIEQAIAHKPDLILMDMSMPVLSGWDATRHLKADPGTADIPIIALTAHALKGDREKTWEAGCDAIVTKPIDDESLENTIEQVLSERRSHATEPSLEPSEVAVTDQSRRSTGKLLSIHNQHVLIADGDPAVSDEIAGELKANGYRTSVADQPDQIISSVESDPPDLIICDAALPVMSGCDLTERLKQDPQLPFIPIILLTKGEFDYERCIEVGVDDFLDKPVNKAKLLARVRSLTRLQQAVSAEANRANELASVLSQMVSGLIIVDIEGTVSVVNGSGLEILGVSLDDVIGANIDDLIGRLDIRDSDSNAVDGALFPLKRALAAEETLSRQLVFIHRRNGDQLVLSFNASPIYNEHGRKIGAVSVFEDVTEEETTRQRLAEQKQELERVNTQLRLRMAR